MSPPPCRPPRVHLMASPGPGLVRRLYVASDDPRSLGEVRRSYPNITALGDWQIAKSAALKTRCSPATAPPSARFSKTSLMGLIQDLLMLQRTNLTICSFTSNVRGEGGPCQICRMVYEVQEARGAEGGQVESLEVLGGAS